MKRDILILSLLVFPFTTHATSILFTLPQKLERACVIAKITVEQVVKPPDTTNPMAYCVIKAKIKELFKGEVGSTIEFRSYMYAHLDVDKLADLIGKDFFIFLHDPHKNKEYWLFQGPMGMRPIQENRDLMTRVNS